MVTKSKKNIKNKEKKQNKLTRSQNSIFLTRKKLKRKAMKSKCRKCRKCSICNNIKNIRNRDEVMMNNLYSNIVSPNNKMINIVSSKCIKCDNNNPTGKLYCRNCDSI